MILELFFFIFLFIIYLDEKISPTSDDGTQALTNSNVQNSVVYGCIGRSSAGDGQRVTSNITVILPGGTYN